MEGPAVSLPVLTHRNSQTNYGSAEAVPFPRKPTKTAIVDGEYFIPKSQTTHEEDCLIVQLVSKRTRRRKNPCRQLR